MNVQASGPDQSPILSVNRDSAEHYRPPFPFNNRHLHTIYPSLFRRVPDVIYQRERLETPDGDFIDLDHFGRPERGTVVLCHGLEGCSRTGYMKGMARALQHHGWEAIAYNYRGCSGEPNRLEQSYHSGATDDLDLVLQHVLQSRPGTPVALVGFSLGGNLILKYLGERGNDVPHEIRGALAFSAPIDLAASGQKLSHPTNWLYMKRFLCLLRRKIVDKNRLRGTKISLEGFDRIRTFEAFDDRFTAPFHGFRNAAHYYRQCSSLNYLEGIRRPALLINAQDDPFLPPTCFPIEAANNLPFFSLERPTFGGHVGFIASWNGGNYWSEQRALAWLSTLF